MSYQEDNNVETYFRILEIPANSTENDVKKAYRKLMLKCHPDVVSKNEIDQDRANEFSKVINEAYTTLKKHLSSKDKYEKIFVKSSNIHSVLYDTFSSILTLEFKNGDIYYYYNVPESIYLDFLNAPSKGKFAHKHIYHVFKYRKV